MNTSVVPSTPAETLKISPESLEVANCYLQYQSIPEVSLQLGISPETITQLLARREVKAYIDSVFLDMGYNNRARVRGLLDNIINKKLEEMEESGIGSSKDITEILALNHKIMIETLDRQIKLEEAKSKNNTIIRNQTNVQLNGGENYQALLNKLLNPSKI